MKITIDLLFLLKIYLLGSLIGLIIGIIVHGFREIKNNFLAVLFLSWIFVIYMLKEFILDKLENHINTYLYCVLKNYLNGRFKKYYILKDYCFMKFISKHNDLSYKKSYFNKYYNSYHRDIYDNTWYTYYDMIEFYFIEKYNK